VLNMLNTANTKTGRQDSSAACARENEVLDHGMLEVFQRFLR
jgi:hypothetical protein